jgi:hypothetical protein
MNRILPIFHNDNWEKITPLQRKTLYSLDDLISLPDGISGEWKASNSLVWNAMKPSLEIASRILMGDTMIPWVSDNIFLYTSTDNSK